MTLKTAANFGLDMRGIYILFKFILKMLILLYRIRQTMHEGDVFVAQIKHIFDENTHRMNGRDKYYMALDFKL